MMSSECRIYGELLKASSRISKPIPGLAPLTTDEAYITDEVYITDGAYITESRNGPTTRQTRFGGMIKALVLSSSSQCR